MVYLSKNLILLPPVADTQDSASEHLKTCRKLGDHFKGTPYFLIHYKIWEFLHFVNFFFNMQIYITNIAFQKATKFVYSYRQVMHACRKLCFSLAMSLVIQYLIIKVFSTDPMIIPDLNNAIALRSFVNNDENLQDFQLFLAFWDSLLIASHQPSELLQS